MADFGGWSAVEELRAQGFEGFVAAGVLNRSRHLLPETPGVYVVLRLAAEAPHFLAVGTSGRYRDTDWNVGLDVLKQRWLPGEQVVYIGKAGGSETAATLRGRVSAYLGFGHGTRAGHRGGRYIWQLADGKDLVFCWRTTPGREPAEVEGEMIATFKARAGQWPFANCKD
ncbi:MAG TPA: hypothetical protein VGO52_24475 [Hyphomonadaceae bacterium]|jgi:hypothetical protein|nr:hypothetical protein [Hyphomonadaceae bacterium]